MEKTETKTEVQPEAEHQDKIDAEKTDAIAEELQKLDTKKKHNPWMSWGLFGLSVLTFYFVGALVHKTAEVVVIGLVILLHELGHYTAMKLFHFRNLRMLFIPLLGGAVSGEPQQGTQPWKHTVVALMGPLPGILIGLATYQIFLLTGYKPFYLYSLFSLAINGFNLLPIFPLDGGHYWEQILFSKHPVSENIFRVGTIGLLLVIAFYVGSPLLIGFALFFLMGAFAAIQTGKIVNRIRAQKLPVPTAGEPIGQEFIGYVLQNMDTSKWTTPKSLARIVKAVRQKFNVEKMPLRQTLFFICFYFAFTGIVSVFAYKILV
ncbi:MAG: site-2 protease family protein [Leptospirales bacterium]